jgi:hypothetical protein
VAVLVQLPCLQKSLPATYPVFLCPCRQSAIIAADSVVAPASHATERRVDWLKRGISSAHQALAEIVKAVAHMRKGRLVGAGFRVLRRPIITVDGPLIDTNQPGDFSEGANRERQGTFWPYWDRQASGWHRGSGELTKMQLWLTALGSKPTRQCS